MKYGVYEVVGNHTYRGHVSGTVFEARIDRNAERRAINRGVLRFVGMVSPELVPSSYTFPDGWLASPHESIQRAPEGALSLRRE